MDKVTLQTTRWSQQKFQIRSYIRETFGLVPLSSAVYDNKAFGATGDRFLLSAQKLREFRR